jgi:nitrilase
MPDKRIVRAAAVQIAPDLERPGGTLEKVLETIDDAARQGVQLIVFPETFLPYYPYFSFVRAPVASGAEHMRLYDEAVVVPGPVTQAVAERARRHGMVVVLGVNERDHGSLYNAQLIFDTDGELLLKRRKITPTFHERMIWGMGDAAGLKVAETSIGRVGALACWEHYNPLARYALMTQHEEIHCSQFPGSLVGPIFGEQIEVTIRHHALESITKDPGLQKALRGGCNTAIISPEGQHLAPPLREGEGLVIADLDMALITKRKRMMDSVGHYARPELLSLAINDRPAVTSAPMNSFSPSTGGLHLERERDLVGHEPAIDD